MHAMMVTTEVLFRVCKTTTRRWTSSRSLLSWIRVSCYVANEDSTHERRVRRTTVERVTSLRLFFVKIPNDLQPNTLPKLVVTVKFPMLRQCVQCTFAFPHNVEDDPFDDERSRGLGACWSPRWNKSLRCLISSRLLRSPLISDDKSGDWCTDAKLKTKVGVV